jgi:hypothetical protein
MLLNVFFNVAIAILAQSFLVNRYWRLCVLRPIAPMSSSSILIQFRKPSAATT